MEPAASIIQKFGGASKLADIVKVHRTRVWNWTRPKTTGGAGGRIPQAHHRTILEASRSLGLGISAEDLLPPETIGETEADQATVEDAAA